MILYEVSVELEPAIKEDYLKWLERHIPEVVEAGGFTDAKCFIVEIDPGARPRICMHYYIESRSALETYFTQHAPALRADATQHFGNRFTATRRIMELLAKPK